MLILNLSIKLSETMYFFRQNIQSGIMALGLSDCIIIKHFYWV